MTIYETLAAAISAEQPVAVATLVGGLESAGAKLLAQPGRAALGSLGAGLPEDAIIKDMLAMLARAESGIRSYATPGGEAQVFIETYPPPPTMFIVGAVHIAIPLVTFAKTLGFRAVVGDAFVRWIEHHRPDMSCRTEKVRRTQPHRWPAYLFECRTAPGMN